MTAKGIPPTRTGNYGGPVVTAGGIIFIGASRVNISGHLIKYRERTLEFQTTHRGYSTPSVFQAEGRQYVVIACGVEKWALIPVIVVWHSGLLMAIRNKTSQIA